MESDKIEKLIGKYFDADTTATEERRLREYFSGEQVAPELESYRPMFNYFTKAKEERFTRQVPLKTRKPYYKWVSVAAVAILAFGFYFGNNYQQKKEAEYAYYQTRKALSLLAENLDRGTDKIGYLNEFEEATQKLYKNN
jgi:hypothetical protein